jgi:hypothetical protein
MVLKQRLEYLLLSEGGQCYIKGLLSVEAMRAMSVYV